MRRTNDLAGLPRLLVAGCVLGLTACTTSTVTTPRSAPQVSQPSQAPQPDVSPQALLRQARSADDRGQLAQRNQLLLQAAAGFIAQQDLLRAQAVLTTLAEEPLPREDQLLLQALMVESALTQSPVEVAKLMPLLSPLASDPAIRSRQLTLQSQLHQQNKEWLAAAQAYAQVMPDTETAVAQVWQWLKQASAADRKLAGSPNSALAPFLALHNLLAEHGHDPGELRRALDQFTRVYRGTALVNHLPAEVTTAANARPQSVDQVAVLLPLSGRFAASGMAVKEGILAAYYQQLQTQGQARSPQLTFHDTQQLTPQNLAGEIGNAQYVIGPLLKDSLDTLVPAMPTGVRVLALNRPDDDPMVSIGTVDSPLIPPALALPQLDRQATWFALAPEDEAYQLAEHMAAQGYRSPIVVAAQGAIYQRLLDAFERRWQARQPPGTDNRLNIVTFNDSSSLKDGITAALGVAQSKERIDQIRYMVNEKLHNVTRNRRDIDAIVVFASPEQTELLNPMVEASLSPFDGSMVPVYATSRSMEYDSSKNQWRDLQNVRFIDMPWMMPGNPWQSLSQQASQLWPDRPTPYARFFAFGVDAFEMLPKTEQMALLPQISHAGLTGTLSVNGKGQVIRRLPQAIISDQAIKPVVSGE